MKLRDTTEEVAAYWAKEGTDIIFAESDPFKGQVSREKLEQNLKNQILKNILEEETAEISEVQFVECIEQSKI
jgi:hypothetical protein